MGPEEEPNVQEDDPNPDDPDVVDDDPVAPLDYSGPVPE